jgi:uncharacterized protein with HEPN domain
MDRDAQYARDMAEAIDKIFESVSGMEYEDFLKDADVFDACVRRLEIIGEASKRLSINLKNSLPKIPWKEIAGFRDKAIHDYASLNAAVVWATIQDDLPELDKALKEYKG